MSVQFICRECLNAYRAGQAHGNLCPSCARKLFAEARRDKTRTDLAADLVRGVPSGYQLEDLK